MSKLCKCQNEYSLHIRSSDPRIGLSSRLSIANIKKLEKTWNLTARLKGYKSRFQLTSAYFNIFQHAAKFLTHKEVRLSVGVRVLLWSPTIGLSQLEIKIIYKELIVQKILTSESLSKSFIRCSTANQFLVCSIAEQKSELSISTQIWFQ